SAGRTDTDHRAARPANADVDNGMVDDAASNVPVANAVSADGMADGTADTTLTVATLEGVDGPYISDSAGNALYFLEGGRDGSKCVDACTVVWMPVAVTAATPSGGPGLDASLVTVVQRPDGSSQVAYNGH